MDTAHHTPALHRRELLRRAVWIVSGGAAVAALDACSGGDQTAKIVLDAAGRYFSPERMTRLDRIAGIIVPATDTPGAREAGVPAFIDAMMVNWASADTRAKWDGVIDAVDAKAVKIHGAPFLQLSEEQQKDIVKAYDAEAVYAPNGDYREFKELLLLGYYHSEAGATQELHYEPVPGIWNACAPLSEIGRTWAD